MDTVSLKIMNAVDSAKWYFVAFAGLLNSDIQRTKYWLLKRIHWPLITSQKQWMGRIGSQPSVKLSKKEFRRRTEHKSKCRKAIAQQMSRLILLKVPDQVEPCLGNELCQYSAAEGLRNSGHNSHNSTKRLKPSALVICVRFRTNRISHSKNLWLCTCCWGIPSCAWSSSYLTAIWLRSPILLQQQPRVLWQAWSGWDSLLNLYYISKGR